MSAMDYGHQINHTKKWRGKNWKTSTFTYYVGISNIHQLVPATPGLEQSVVYLHKAVILCINSI